MTATNMIHQLNSGPKTPGQWYLVANPKHITLAGVGATVEVLSA